MRNEKGVPHFVFLGLGNMGGAIASAIFSTEKRSQKLRSLLSGCSLTLVDPQPKQVEELLGLEQLELADNNKARLLNIPSHLPLLELSYKKNLSELKKPVDILLLAVKPQYAAEALRGVREKIHSETLAVSIMAGTSSTTIGDYLGLPTPVLRAMPNLPARLGLGLTTLYKGKASNSSYLELATELFKSCGEILLVETEELIDAGTALVGSGPGFLYHLLQGAEKAAITMGFTAEEAKLLSTQTVKGAISLYQESELELSELEKRVTSPKGTTEAGISELKATNAISNLDSAFQAAFQRAIQLRS